MHESVKPLTCKALVSEGVVYYYSQSFLIWKQSYIFLLHYALDYCYTLHTRVYTIYIHVTYIHKLLQNEPFTLKHILLKLNCAVICSWVYDLNQSFASFYHTPFCKLLFFLTKNVLMLTFVKYISLDKVEKIAGGVNDK